MTKRRVKTKPIAMPKRNGAPVAINFFEGSDTYRKGDSEPLMTLVGYRDTDQLLTNSDWRQLLSAGRFLFANVPILRGAILEQLTYSLPLTPQYTGEDKEFAKVVEDWLWSWHEIFNVAGPAFDFNSTCRNVLSHTKIDGDIFTILTKGNSGFPLIQIIPAHRIGWRLGNGKIPAGPYAGLYNHNGVITNKFRRPVAFNFLGDTPEEDFVYAFPSVVHSYRPESSDQVRGISHLCATIRSFQDIKRLREYEMRAQQIQSSFAVVERNEQGEFDSIAEQMRRGDVAPEATEAPVAKTLQSGLIQYFRAGSGSGLELLRPDRPSADAQAFEDKIVTQALYGIEWDPNFAIAIQQPGGAYARTVIEKVRRSIGNNQALLTKWAKRVDTYGIAVEIKRGNLPMPRDPYWWNYLEYQTPQRITADTGNEENAKRANYLLGTMTLQEISGERGKYWVDQRMQREIETRDLLDRAKKLADTYDISLDIALQLLEQRVANYQQFPTDGEDEPVENRGGQNDELS